MHRHSSIGFPLLCLIHGCAFHALMILDLTACKEDPLYGLVCIKYKIR